MQKYRNIKTVVDGHKFDSKKEAAAWSRLVLELKSGQIAALQTQVKFTFPDGNGGLIRYQKSKRPLTYVADFVYIRHGQRVVADVKGMRTQVYKIKAALMFSLLGISILESKIYQISTTNQTPASALSCLEHIGYITMVTTRKTLDSRALSTEQQLIRKFRRSTSYLPTSF